MKDETPRGPAPTASRWLWIWGPAIAQMAAIFVASSIPNLTELPLDMPDYVGHFIGYFLLGALLVRALAGARWANLTTRVAAISWAASAFYGATDEGHQAFVPGRSPSMRDWLTDALGAAVAIGLAWIIATLVARHRARDRAV